MRLCGFLAALVVLASTAHGAPLLFHGHGHGLSFSADGTALLAPSERGLAVHEQGSWRESAGDGFSGFSASERALYSSGHAQAGRPACGLIRSTDAGRVARPKDGQALAFATRRREVYVTSDGGANWRRISAEEKQSREAD